MPNPKKVYFYFDFGSPASYLAWTQLPKIVESSNANMELIPMLLGGVFKAVGNTPPGSVPAKGRWMSNDLKMHAKMYGVKFQFNDFFAVVFSVKDLFLTLN